VITEAPGRHRGRLPSGRRPPHGTSVPRPLEWPGPDPGQSVFFRKNSSLWILLVGGKQFDSSATSNAVLCWTPSDWVGGILTGSLFLRCDASRPIPPPSQGKSAPYHCLLRLKCAKFARPTFPRYSKYTRGYYLFRTQTYHLPEVGPWPGQTILAKVSFPWGGVACTVGCSDVLSSLGGLAPAPQVSFLSFPFTSPHKHAILPNSKFYFQFFYTQPSDLLTTQSWPKPIILVFLL